jgi:hypothetical protein
MIGTDPPIPLGQITRDLSCPWTVVEVSYVEMTPDGLLRHVVYLGEREDKLARDVIRSKPA